MLTNRMGASYLAEGGASLTMIKAAGGWKSSTACEGYIEDSLLSKRKVADTLNIDPRGTKKLSSETFVSRGKENVPPPRYNPGSGSYSNCTFFLGGGGASSSVAVASSSSSSSGSGAIGGEVDEENDDDSSVSLKLMLPVCQ